MIFVLLIVDKTGSKVFYKALNEKLNANFKKITKRLN